MKNKPILFTVSLICVLGLMAGTKAVYLSCQEEGIDNKELGAIYSPERVICDGASATTTLTYLTTTGATSTCYAFVSDADRVDLKWITMASTSSSVLNWAISFANEDEPSERTWYPEKNYTVTSNNVTTYSGLPTGRVMALESTTASTTYHNTSVENSNDKWLKVDYSSAGANIGVHLEIVPKNNVE